MNYEQFAIWLHGFLEISNAETINKEQTQIIKDHLALLFEKKTPDRQKKEETDMDRIQKHIKRLQEEMRKNRIDHDDYPTPPPYIPPPKPAYPNWQWVPPEPVYCKDSTASPPLDLGTTVCNTQIPDKPAFPPNQLMSEGAVKMTTIPVNTVEPFPSDIYPHKTINNSKEAFENFNEKRKIRC